MSEEKQAEAPTSELIAVKAFELYCERGCEDGHDTEDWLEAEALLAAPAGESASDADWAKEGRDDVGRS
ncbi:MAG: DUF2934 domain-containing protein [Dehalococcoidia bacterium]